MSHLKPAQFQRADAVAQADRRAAGIPEPMLGRTIRLSRRTFSASNAAAIFVGVLALALLLSGCAQVHL